VQVVHGEWFRERAGEQYITPSNYAFERGSIFFQKKNSDLLGGGVVTTGFKVAINSNKISDPEAVYLALSEITDLDKDKFLKTIAKKDSYEEVVHRLTKELADRVATLNLPGVSVFKEKWRFYPGGNLASHVLGIMGFKGDEYAGRYGLERQYEAELLRKDGAFVNFFAQIFSDIKKATQETNENEADIITTIEPTVQSYLQEIIASTTEKWTSDATGGIIMNPSTGEIYAMGFFPTFDLNNPQKEKAISIFSKSSSSIRSAVSAKIIMVFPGRTSIKPVEFTRMCSSPFF